MTEPTDEEIEQEWAGMTLTPRRPALTTQQQRVLSFIEHHISDVGYAPSLAQIGEAVGLLSRTSVTWHLLALANAGYIRRDPRVARGIVLMEAP